MCTSGWRMAPMSVTRCCGATRLVGGHRCPRMSARRETWPVKQSRSGITRQFRLSLGIGVAVSILLTSVGAGVGTALGATNGNHALAASHGSKAASAPPLCLPSAVQISATTAGDLFNPEQPVVMTSSITNTSHTPCSVWLGLDPGFSPSFTVTNSKGDVVWDRCWIHDTPGACFMILVAHRLAPGASYSKTVTWDQRSAPDGQRPVPVPHGTYQFTTHYQYIAGNPSVAFKLGVTHPAECSGTAVSITASTNRRSYTPGEPVLMATSITNISTESCSAVLGLDPGYSPSFIVTNSAHKIVWDRCWIDDQPGACFEILVTYPLSPGQSFTEKAAWDQLSGTQTSPPVQVPPGTYRLTCRYFQGVATTTFQLRQAS